MLNAVAKGNEKYLEFVSDHLVDGTKCFFSPIKKVNLKTGIVKEKRTPHAVSIIKEDRQAFGITIAKATSLEEAFQYPVTSVSLSIATPDATLCQSDKASLQNFLISESGAFTDQLPKNAHWLVDGMAAVRSLKPRETYAEWIKSFIKFTTPPESADACSLGIINDTYREISIKSGTRKRRGNAGQRVQLGGFEQHMLQGEKWQEFLHSGEALTRLMLGILENGEGQKYLSLPTVFTSGETTVKIQDRKVTEIFNCNHEEADTRLILHAALTEGDVVIVAKDTDVLILMIWAHHAFGIRHKWLMKYDNNKYAEIDSICNFLGDELCRVLTAIHALSGCDTTSYFYNVGKVKTLKKIKKNPSRLQLINAIGREETLSESEVEKIKEFIRTTMYNGKSAESYLETRVRLYKSMKTKTSMSIPPDQHSMVQAIKRVHYQAFHWYRCTDIRIPNISLEDHGWKSDQDEGRVLPTWFTGSQLPLSFKTNRSQQRACNCEDNNGDADISDIDEDGMGEVSVRQASTPTSGIDSDLNDDESD